jgi:hypothetical protein
MSIFEATIAVLVGGALLVAVAMVAVLAMLSMLVLAFAYAIEFIKMVFDQ